MCVTSDQRKKRLFFFLPCDGCGVDVCVCVGERGGGTFRCRNYFYDDSYTQKKSVLLC